MVKLLPYFKGNVVFLYDECDYPVGLRQMVEKQGTVSFCKSCGGNATANRRSNVISWTTIKTKMVNARGNVDFYDARNEQKLPVCRVIIIPIQN